MKITHQRADSRSFIYSSVDSIALVIWKVYNITQEEETFTLVNILIVSLQIYLLKI